MLRIGIYYAFWEDRWQADYSRYIRKAAQLGLDILEIACTPIPWTPAATQARPASSSAARRERPSQSPGSTWANASR